MGRNKAEYEYLVVSKTTKLPWESLKAYIVEEKYDDKSQALAKANEIRGITTLPTYGRTRVYAKVIKLRKK